MKENHRLTILIIVILCFVTNLLFLIFHIELKREKKTLERILEKQIKENQSLIMQNEYLKEQQYFVLQAIKDSLLQKRINNNLDSVRRAIKFFGTEQLPR